MTKDYKKCIPSYRRRNARPWKVIGLAACGLIGVVSFGAYWFFGDGNDSENSDSQPSVTVSTPSHSSSVNSTRGKKSEKQEQRAESEKPNEPRFTFYKILPEKEVIIPEIELKTIKREESTGKPPTVSRYLIQAGSFTNQQDAEKLKMQLAQIRVLAKLEMIQVENSVWYRVKIGPYVTLSDVEKVREHLRNHKIDSIVQKAAK